MESTQGIFVTCTSGLGDEFVDENTSNGGDLYDAALEPSNDDDSALNISSTSSRTHRKRIEFLSPSTTQVQSSTTAPTTSRRYYCCYIGNMTWWTTDADLRSAIDSVSIDGDLIDIKFYDYRNNGQSKGFALAVFSTESAVRQCIEKLSQKVLHGQQLVVLPYTKSSLAKCEEATRRPGTDIGGDNKAIVNFGMIRIGQTGTQQQAPIPLRVVPQSLAGIRQQQPPQLMHQQIICPMIQRPILLPPMHQAPPGFPSRGAHINPQVYPGFMPSIVPPPTIYQHHVIGCDGPLSDVEFDEIMTRNRTVSSSALSRAITDTAAGDYTSAIETLVTAISLVRQSRVANHDRCKALITSLQDALHHIEARSYARGGGSSSSKDRSSRDHRGSPDQRSSSSSSSSRKRHRRSRSRSRERNDGASSDHALRHRRN